LLRLPAPSAKASEACDSDSGIARRQRGFGSGTHNREATIFGIDNPSGSSSKGFLMLVFSAFLIVSPPAPPSSSRTRSLHLILTRTLSPHHWNQTSPEYDMCGKATQPAVESPGSPAPCGNCRHMSWLASYLTVAVQ